MRNQIAVEFYKAIRFSILYIAALVIIISGFLYGNIKISSNLDFNIARVFSAVIGDTSFIFIISLVVSWFIGNDFLYRTIHNEIKIGYSRISVVLVRVLPSIVMAMFLHLAYIFSAIIGFSIKNGFDDSMFTVSNFVWLLTVMVQVCSIVCIVIFIVFALKKVTSGIAVSTIFIVICCSVLRNFINDTVFKLTPFSLAQTSDSKNLAISSIVAISVIFVSLISTHFIFRKTEVK